jgi:opacity protein-like surface antigen
VGYALTPRLTIDLAYKYVDTGDVRNNGALTFGGPSFFQLTPSKTGDVGVHAVTLGFRYELRATITSSIRFVWRESRYFF